MTTCSCMCPGVLVAYQRMSPLQTDRGDGAGTRAPRTTKPEAPASKQHSRGRGFFSSGVATERDSPPLILSLPCPSGSRLAEKARPPSVLSWVETIGMLWSGSASIGANGTCKPHMFLTSSSNSQKSTARTPGAPISPLSNHSRSVSAMLNSTMVPAVADGAALSDSQVQWPAEGQYATPAGVRTYGVNNPTRGWDPWAFVIVMWQLAIQDNSRMSNGGEPLAHDRPT